MRTLKMLAGAVAMFATAATGWAAVAVAQVPVDAASDRRAGAYVYFQSFGAPALMNDLVDVQAVRADSARYFTTRLATCALADEACSADTVYELADRFCQAVEFEEAVTWRTSKTETDLVLHFAVCGLKK